MENMSVDAGFVEPPRFDVGDRVIAVGGCGPGLLGTAGEWSSPACSAVNSRCISRAITPRSSARRNSHPSERAAPAAPGTFRACRAATHTGWRWGKHSTLDCLPARSAGPRPGDSCIGVVCGTVVGLGGR